MPCEVRGRRLAKLAGVPADLFGFDRKRRVGVIRHDPRGVRLGRSRPFDVDLVAEGPADDFVAAFHRYPFGWTMLPGAVYLHLHRVRTDGAERNEDSELVPVSGGST